MGALYAGRCYSTATDAAAAVWSGVSPVLSAGSPPSVSTVEFDGAAWQVVTREEGVTVAVVAAPVPMFAECDPADSVRDGLALGWMVGAVWLAAWGVRYLGRVVTGRA